MVNNCYLHTKKKKLRTKGQYEKMLVTQTENPESQLQQTILVKMTWIFLQDAWSCLFLKVQTSNVEAFCHRKLMQHQVGFAKWVSLRLQFCLKKWNWHRPPENNHEFCNKLTWKPNKVPTKSPQLRWQPRNVPGSHDSLGPHVMRMGLNIFLALTFL